MSERALTNSSMSLASIERPLKMNLTLFFTKSSSLLSPSSLSRWVMGPLSHSPLIFSTPVLKMKPFLLKAEQ